MIDFPASNNMNDIKSKLEPFFNEDRVSREINFCGVHDALRVFKTHAVMDVFHILSIFHFRDDDDFPFAGNNINFALLGFISARQYAVAFKA